MSRITMKMQLQKDLAEAQQRKAANQQASSFTMTSAIFLPNSSTGMSTSVPGEILQVETNLQHPTRYHVRQKQRDQVANYLSNSVGTTKVDVNQFLRPHGSLPDKTVQGIGRVSGTSAPASPLAQLHLSTSVEQQLEKQEALDREYMKGGRNCAFYSANMTLVRTAHHSYHNHLWRRNPERLQVDDIYDDIVSLQSSYGDDRGQLSTTLPTIDINALPSFAASAASTLGVYDQNKTSSSCPPEILPKQEYFDDESRVGNVQDRVKKDNHNRIERRRRYNINDRIKELGTMVPRNSDPDLRWNKGSILKASVDRMRELQSKVARTQQVERKQQEMRNMNKRLLLRIQELEMLAKSNGLEVPLMPDKQEIVDSLFSVDAVAMGSDRKFSKEEEFEVASFPTHPIQPAFSSLNPVFKQEKISPTHLTMQDAQDLSTAQYITTQHYSPSNYASPQHTTLQPPQQHIVSIDITSPHSYSPQMQQVDDSTNFGFQGNQGLITDDSQMGCFDDNVPSFSSLLNQSGEVNFDDVLMDQDPPIKSDIFLSDSLHQL